MGKSSQTGLKMTCDCMGQRLTEDFMMGRGGAKVSISEGRQIIWFVFSTGAKQGGMGIS